ncbi:hypothetical protein ACFOLJ_16055 [Rugamonas sp. CCM 8940]|uniref:hypothetical protein n=1 Tax=Rugamonas sp. CCM 8940 TaxID=2765359 RepID=UPI00351C0581
MTRRGDGYNANDQLSTLTYPRSGKVVSYAPDVLGRPTQASNYLTAIDYWPSGQIKRLTYGNGTAADYGQNERMWPSSFVVQKGAARYLSTTYGYDGTGNLGSILDTVDSGLNRTLGYDGINRLITADGPWGAGAIAYDGVGNIIRQAFGGSSWNYSYDSSNRLNSISGNQSLSFTYDAYGNITTTRGSTFTYDGAPNLRCVNCSDSTRKIEYAYDGRNRRIAVTKAGIKTYEMYSAQGNLMVEYTPSQQNRLVEYIYVGDKRVAQRVTP